MNITEKIRSALKRFLLVVFKLIYKKPLTQLIIGYYWKGLTTMEFQIYLKRLKSFLTEGNQFTNIKEKSSCKLAITGGVPGWTLLLVSLLFILYINDLLMAIQNSSVHHFVDDTNLLYTINSLNVLNKHINHDLKQLCQWL